MKSALSVLTIQLNRGESVFDGKKQLEETMGKKLDITDLKHAFDTVEDNCVAIIKVRRNEAFQVFESTWGGPREGAGRPATGAMPNKTIRMTDDEYIKVKEYLKQLRTSSK